jgi:VWFA-related protein
LLLLILPCHAQQDRDLIRIPATVVDSEGHYITTLRAEDFTVEIGGVRQPISEFTQDFDTPVSLGIVVDVSASMKDAFPATRQAASTFIRGMHPKDEFFLMTFAARTNLKQDFTEDRSRLDRALDSVTRTRPGTHLFAAVEKAAAMARMGKYKKRALVVISDGGDISFTKFTTFQSRLRSSEVLMYALQMQSAGSARVFGILGPSAETRTAIMQSLSSETGGRWFAIDTRAPADQLTRQFNEAFSTISSEIRAQYTIGIYSTKNFSSSKIRVHTVNPDYHVRTRE